MDETYELAAERSTDEPRAARWLHCSSAKGQNMPSTEHLIHRTFGSTSGGRAVAVVLALALTPIAAAAQADRYRDQDRERGQGITRLEPGMSITVRTNEPIRTTRTDYRVFPGV